MTIKNQLLKRVRISTMPMRALCCVVVLLFLISIVVANDAVEMGQEESNQYHRLHHQLYAPSVPNGEKSSQSRSSSSFNDNELMPWYIDFINLPSDGTLFSLRYESSISQKAVYTPYSVVFRRLLLPPSDDDQFRGQDRHG